jgi:ATP-dependent RNA helicase RhlE
VTLLQSLMAKETGSFLVFARTKHGADRLSHRLTAAGFKTAAIHGDRSQSQRNQALRGFQEGYYRVLVATDVAARGIHVDDIAHVVNFDLPRAPEDFIHRVGRTARAGRRGVASSFFTPSERGAIRHIERVLSLTLTRHSSAHEVPELPVSVPVTVPVRPFQVGPLTAIRGEARPARNARPIANRPAFAPRRVKPGGSFRFYKSA